MGDVSATLLLIKSSYNSLDSRNRFINNCSMRKLLTLTLAFLLTLSALVFIPSAHASNKTVKNLYFSLTFPSVVKMPKGNCGSFKVSYTLGIKAKQAGIGSVTSGVVVDESDLAAGTLWYLNNEPFGTPLKNKGTATWKFCKEDWITDDDDARIGIFPGSHQIGFVSEFNSDVQEKWATIKFVK